MGCDLIARMHCTKQSKFQSTHPHGVRPPRLRHELRSEPYFNPRTRMGCDVREAAPQFGRRRISIHAPAWGATGLCRRHYEQLRISIHAPAWGATQKHQFHFSRQYRISIHAPAWGATILGKGKTANKGNFNPRTRMGCDRSFAFSCAPLRNFNPRTRMGCDVSFKGGGCMSVISIHAPAWGATRTA